MMVYGNGGVGKTTFASTAPKPLLIDCENGSKYFGMRGIEVDVAKISEWSDLNGVFEIAKSGEYETIIIDPIGELMEKLKMYMVKTGDKKLVQSDGSPSMAGWGWLKDKMRGTIKLLRDSGVNLILVAHVDEKPDEDKIIKRPMLMTKLSDEVVNMVDIVGYMTVLNQEDEEKRIIMVDPASDKYIAKDRTGQLGKYIPPEFDNIVKAVQGTESFSWSKNEVVEEVEEDTEEPPEEETPKKKAVKKTAKKSTSKKTTKKAEEDDGEVVE